MTWEAPVRLRPGIGELCYASQRTGNTERCIPVIAGEVHRSERKQPAAVRHGNRTRWWTADRAEEDIRSRISEDERFEPSTLGGRYGKAIFSVSAERIPIRPSQHIEADYACEA